MENKKNQKTEEKVNKKTEEKNNIEPIKFSGKYIKAVGRRKTSVAQTRLYENGRGVLIVNGMKINEYFGNVKSAVATQALKLTGHLRDFNFSILVKGGGKSGQAEAIRHSIARILVSFNEELKSVLKAKNLLTRDSRKKERKKPGLKKARKAPQWSKR